jgi:CRP/FNR family transcriptional regulator, cyclic AMP receptor protein
LILGESGVTLLAVPKVAELLSQTPFLAGLDTGLLGRLAERLRSRELQPGDVVFREGETGRSMFVVEVGELVAIQAGDGEAVQLRRFKSGDHFGGLALVDAGPRTATVAATSHARVHELTDSALFGLCREDQKAYVTVLENALREVTRQLRRAASRSPGLAAEAEDPDPTEMSLEPFHH